jgi:hypothetical protein
VLIRWNLLFCEPWFLGLGVLVTLGALHHHRRTGGSRRGARRLLAATAAATLALTALAGGLCDPCVHLPRSTGKREPHTCRFVASGAIRPAPLRTAAE